MAVPMSPLSGHGAAQLKRKRTRWPRTLAAGVVIATAMLFGLWQISLTYHARFRLDPRPTRHPAQQDQLDYTRFPSGTSEVEMLLEAASLQSQNVNAEVERMRHEIQALGSGNAKLRSQFRNHLVETPAVWKSLKDLSKFSILGFLSDVPDRGSEQGPPQLFEFPSGISQGRHLCFLGNATSNGTRNFYTYAWEGAMPRGHVLLNGTTLVSETQYDYGNPWHSMFNLVQFVYWKQVNRCADAERVLLYHWSELRRSMGGWITQVFTAAGLPTVPYRMEVGDRPVCFQRAVVSRTGIGGVPQSELQEMFKEVRCLVRRHCNIPVASFQRSKKQRVRITLMVRSRTREWKNQTEWEALIARECAHIQGCTWSAVRVANLTFCEQAAAMSRTDVLVSVHGAQLTNMIFMSPGGRVLEMFPKGWLELAGQGQFIYRYLAEWIGLYHEGYWRDLDHADCPFGDDNARCMTHYKDLPVGLNATHISSWLRGVVADFIAMQIEMKKPVNERSKPALLVAVQWDSHRCACTPPRR